MAITGGFGFTLYIKSGKIRNWYMRKDGIKRWADNDRPVDVDHAIDESFVNSEQLENIEQLK